MTNLETKYTLYKSLLSTYAQDKHGFIDSKNCDSLLFTGLVGCVPDVTVNIKAAFDTKTQLWHRRPVEKSCYPKHSKSTISRDMLVGLAWYCWANNRKDIAEQVVKYALSNMGIMGKAVDWKVLIGRCFVGPGLLGTFARIAGWKYCWLWWLPTDVPGAPILEDFQAHLQVLHRLLRYRMSKKDSSRDRILQAQAARQPNNPLFQVAVGNHSQALKSLSNEQLWPSERLPSSSDRKEAWLLQRDYGKDWKPSDSEHLHSGGDFLFCYYLMKGK